MAMLVFGLALLAKLAHGARDGPVPVDFYVFLGKDGDKENVPPLASMNINAPDNVTGFSILCKDRCPMFDVSCGPGCTSPQMRWCSCVAELLVKDLVFDFSALLDNGAPPVFTLGDYVEVKNGQEYYNIRDGHTALYSLMEADSKHAYARRAGRVAVWVANHVATVDDPHSMLGGTTLLDQPLWQGGPGAGVLLYAGNDRSSKILSHEMGHVVGFHHTAGPSLMYTYEHAECPKEYRRVESHPLVFPTCEVNIMGYWYDGPYCCPGALLQRPSFLQLRGRSNRQQCLENSLTDFQEANCCGDECVHECPKQMPEPTFATKEHKDILSKMLHCWQHLRTVPAPEEKLAPGNISHLANATNMGLLQSSMECFDYPSKMGASVVKVGYCKRHVQ